MRVLLRRCRAAWTLGLFLVAISASGPTRAEPLWGLDQLMAAMGQVQAGHAAFIEKKYVNLLNTPLVLKGTLDYKAPGRVEKHVLDPYDEAYIVDGDSLVVDNKTKGVRRTLSLQAYPAVWAFVESFRGTLSGDQAALRRFYQVSLSGTRQAWSLTLVPRNADMARMISRIRIDGSGTRIRTIDVEEAGGDRSVMDVAEGTQ